MSDFFSGGTWVSWTVLKQQREARRLWFQSVETEHSFRVFIIENGAMLCTEIFKDGVPLPAGVDSTENTAARSDWSDNWSSFTIPPQRTDDGRQIVAPISFDDGTFLYICGRGDHATDGRGEGVPFRLSRTTAGESTVEWGFNDWIKAVGGEGTSVGGGDGDEACFGLYAPATTIEAVTPGTGSAILVDTGFTVESTTLNVVVPYPNGTHNVTHAVPVPVSVGEAGFWSWDCPDFGEGTVTAAQGGAWNLYDIDIPLARHAAWIQLLGSRTLAVKVDNVKPMIIPPQWRFTATLRTTADRDVSMVWEMETVRMRSTKIW